MRSKNPLLRFLRKGKKEKVDHAALTTSIAAGEVEQVEYYLQSGLDPNEEDPMGRMPIVLAIHKDSRQMVTVLVKKGAEIGYKDEFGNNLLAIATMHAAGFVFPHLLELGLDFTAANLQHEDFLDKAKGTTCSIFEQYVLRFREKLRSFIQQAQQEAAAKFGRAYQNRLHVQVYEQRKKQDHLIWSWPLPKLELHLKKLDRYIASKGLSPISVKEKKQVNLSPSHLLTMATQAIRKKDLDLLKDAIDQGWLPEHGNTASIPPLFLALAHFDPLVLLLLLDYGADPNQVHDQQTPSLKAVLNANVQALGILLENKADPLLEINGRNAFLASIDSKQYLLSLLILNEGYDANYASPNGSVLESLLQLNDPDWVNFLAACNFDPNRPQNGHHAIDRCIAEDKWDLLMGFLKAGLNPERWSGGYEGLIAVILQERQWPILTLLLDQYRFSKWSDSLKQQLDSRKAPSYILKKLRT
ncbi:MAG: hypothetical protein AAFV80_05995 [Bacteroidota bacterium]